jgi:hypothetical protein
MKETDNNSKKLSKENYRHWITGLLLYELGVSILDIDKIKKLQKCSEEIIRFGEEHNFFKKTDNK